MVEPPWFFAAPPATLAAWPNHALSGGGGGGAAAFGLPASWQRSKSDTSLGGTRDSQTTAFSVTEAKLTCRQA